MTNEEFLVTLETLQAKITNGEHLTTDVTRPYCSWGVCSLGNVKPPENYSCPLDLNPFGRMADCVNRCRIFSKDCCRPNKLKTAWLYENMIKRLKENS